MTFMTDKWTIAKFDLSNMILVRKSKDEIILEVIVGNQNNNSRKVLAKDVFEEYDLDIESPNHIYLIYQNREMHLMMITIKDKKIEEVKLTSKPISEVFNLYILEKNKGIHIFYQIKISEEKDNYMIEHHYYDGSKWKSYLVDEIIVNRALNPLSIISTEDKLIASYYSSGNSIELKEFNLNILEWGKAIKLVTTMNDKLYLDMIKIEKDIHLTYCEFIDGNLMIRYERLSYDDSEIRKDIKVDISNEGSPHNPTLIFYEDKLWITWVELDKIISRYSVDNGQNWGPIYMWNNSKTIDFIRYKYLDMIPEEGIRLNYSFGRIHPEVSFMGFGPTDKAIEVPIKKKKSMNIPRV